MSDLCTKFLSKHRRRCLIGLVKDLKAWPNITGSKARPPGNITEKTWGSYIIIVYFSVTIRFTGFLGRCYISRSWAAVSNTRNTARHVRTVRDDIRSCWICFRVQCNTR